MRPAAPIEFAMARWPLSDHTITTPDAPFIPVTRVDDWNDGLR